MEIVLPSGPTAVLLAGGAPAPVGVLCENNAWPARARPEVQLVSSARTPAWKKQKPGLTPKAITQAVLVTVCARSKFGAEEGIRTLDPLLGKEVLYH